MPGKILIFNIGIFFTIAFKTFEKFLKVCFILFFIFFANMPSYEFLAKYFKCSYIFKNTVENLLSIIKCSAETTLFFLFRTILNFVRRVALFFF